MCISVHVMYYTFFPSRLLLFACESQMFVLMAVFFFWTSRMFIDQFYGYQKIIYENLTETYN